MVLEDVTSIEQLCRSIRGKLGKGRGGPNVLRSWASSDLITIDEFTNAMGSLNLNVSPQVAGALFRTLSGGPSLMAIALLQRLIFGAPTKAGSSKRAPSATSKAVALAVELGVRPAETEKDAKAAEVTFSKDAHCASEVDRFAWEANQNKPYWMVGDPKYDTPEALERRVALLRSGRVVRACRQFWDTLMLDEDDTLDKKRYEMVHRLLTKALAPEMGEAEWREAASDDWRDDLRGHSDMSMALYLMSIFEIADLWTDSIEEWAYVVLINKLFRRVTKPRPAKRSKPKKRWQLAGASAMLQAASNAAQAAADSDAAVASTTQAPAKMSMAAVLAAARQAAVGSPPGSPAQAEAASPSVAAEETLSSTGSAWRSTATKPAEDSPRTRVASAPPPSPAERGATAGAATASSEGAVSLGGGADTYGEGSSSGSSSEEEGEGASEAAVPHCGVQRRGIMRCFRELEEVTPIPHAELEAMSGRGGASTNASRASSRGPSRRPSGEVIFGDRRDEPLKVRSPLKARRQPAQSRPAPSRNSSAESAVKQASRSGALAESRASAAAQSVVGDDAETPPPDAPTKEMTAHKPVALMSRRLTVDHDSHDDVAGAGRRLSPRINLVAPPEADAAQCELAPSSAPAAMATAARATMSNAPAALPAVSAPHESAARQLAFDEAAGAALVAGLAGSPLPSDVSLSGLWDVSDGSAVSGGTYAFDAMRAGPSVQPNSGTVVPGGSSAKGVTWAQRTRLQGGRGTSVGGPGDSEGSKTTHHRSRKARPTSAPMSPTKLKLGGTPSPAAAPNLATLNIFDAIEFEVHAPAPAPPLREMSPASLRPEVRPPRPISAPLSPDGKKRTGIGISSGGGGGGGGSSSGEDGGRSGSRSCSHSHGGGSASPRWTMVRAVSVVGRSRARTPVVRHLSSSGLTAAFKSAASAAKAVPPGLTTVAAAPPSVASLPTLLTLPDIQSAMRAPLRQAGMSRDPLQAKSLNQLQTRGNGAAAAQWQLSAGKMPLAAVGGRTRTSTSMGSLGKC